MENSGQMHGQGVRVLVFEPQFHQLIRVLPIWPPFPYVKGFLDGSIGKDLPAVQETWVGNGNPLQYSCLENSMDRGAWQGTVHGVAESDVTERQMATVHGVSKSWTQLSMHTCPCTP